MVKEQVSICISNETVAQHRLRLQKLQISEDSVQGYTVCFYSMEALHDILCFQFTCITTGSSWTNATQHNYTR